MSVLIVEMDSTVEMDDGSMETSVDEADGIGESRDPESMSTEVILVEVSFQA